jgi:tetratricopeptide (TPR) repeat protein
MDLKRFSLAIRIAVALLVGIPLFHWGTAAMRAGEGLELNFGAAFEIAIAVLLYGLFVAALFARPLIDRVGTAFERLYMGRADDSRIIPEYSVAEAQLMKGRYREAVDAYRDVVAEHPDDIYPHLRIAELAVKHLNDLKLAELELLAAMGKAKGEDSAALAAGRLADFYQLTLRDPARALEAMKQLREKIPGSKQAKLAEERIAVLEGIVHGGVPLPKAPGKIAHRKSRYSMWE